MAEVQSRDSTVEKYYLSIIAIVLAVLLSVFVQGALIRPPILRLTRIVKRLAEGDQNVTLPSSSRNELGELAKAVTSLHGHVAAVKGRLSEQLCTSSDMAHELQRVNAKLDTIFNSISYGLIIANSEGVIDSVNPALCHITGYGTEELVGCNVKMLMEDELAAHHDELLHSYREIGDEGFIGRAPIEVQLIAKSGVLIPVEIALEEMVLDGGRYFAALIQDIRERKENERAVKKERDMAEHYLNTIEVMMVAIDREGVINLINRKGCQILGYEAKELIGKNWFESCVPEELRQECVELYTSPDKAAQLEYKELPVITATGMVKTIAWHYNVLNDDEGNMSGLLASGTDITEVRAKEREREQIRNQLQQAQKMEAVGQLTGGIAHDFNNIIASIMGHTELVMTRLKYVEDEKVRKYLDHVYKSGERARDLVEKMLAFSRGQGGGAPSDVQLDAAIEDVIKMLRSIIPSTIAIESHYEREAISALTTTIDLQQIIMNLCINARDAMKGAGKIDISVYTSKRMRGVCSSCHGNLDGDYVVVSVKDTGVGISKQDQLKIFEPFFTTKGVGEGSGMGLSVVHGVIHDHGGHLQVISELGKGTEFRIYLKSSDYQVRGPEEHSVPLDTDIERNGVILVVDDEPLVGNFVSEVLEGKGHTVVSMAEPKRALETVKSNPTVISLIITDYSMPEMDGIALAEKVRDLECHVPIIVCTGYSDAIDPDRSQEAGISAIINKPMRAEELISLVDMVLASRKLIHFPDTNKQL